MASKEKKQLIDHLNLKYHFIITDFSFILDFDVYLYIDIIIKIKVLLLLYYFGSDY